MAYPEGLLPLEYLDRSGEFFHAYKALPATPPPSWPRYFMLCHAIELALRAYVAGRRGLTQTQLYNEFRHDLKDLLTEAISLGLSISSAAQQGITLLDEAHTKYWPRYPREDGGPVWVIDHFEPYAAELLEAVSKALVG
jgi:hypothetical protein